MMSKLMSRGKLFFILFLFAVGIAFWFAGRDIPPPDVSDLIIARLEIPPEENAYTYYASATNALFSPTNSLFYRFLSPLGRPVDTNALAEALAKNAKMIEHITRGNQCQRSVPPDNNFDQGFLDVNARMNMTRILASQAKHDRLSGRYTEATDACLTLIRFAVLNLKEPENILHYNIAKGMLVSGLKQVRDLSGDPQLPHTELRRLSSALSDMDTYTPSFLYALKAEFSLISRTIDQHNVGYSGIKTLMKLGREPSLEQFRTVPHPRYTFHPNRTTCVLAHAYRAFLVNVPTSYAKANQNDTGEIPFPYGKSVFVLLKPNALGQSFYESHVRTLTNCGGTRFHTETSLPATRLHLACTRFKREHGRFPATLQDLVPAYIEQVPLDPYDGKPFKYAPDKRVIYSVGKDLCDSGGATNSVPYSSSKDPRKIDDPVFPLENYE